GFDHAAVHEGLGRVYVAHTANDAVDVIDAEAQRCVGSVDGLTGVAGALVSEERGLVFTSNRGENTVGIFTPGAEAGLARVPVGVGPNGLAYDPRRDVLLAANVGDPDVPGSHTVSLVDVAGRARLADVQVEGRTRWAVFDPASQDFYVNIAAPPRIAAIDVPARRTARALPVPAAGPHGLDLDPVARRLFCACDAGTLVAMHMESGRVLGTAALSGPPDVIFFNPALRHLYVAIGEPGVIDVFETDTLQRIETVATEAGAHTLGFDARRATVYAFLPGTHRAAVYLDRE
ncbi:MAG TPA: YncE family protein, partial [Methylomirabilota bacterium]|nr:YncE family protein [Methylomirabilota bacterium]